MAWYPTFSAFANEEMIAGGRYKPFAAGTIVRGTLGVLP